MLVSISIFALILAMTARIVNDARTTWSSASSRVSQFRDARLAFELITRNVSQATLNTYFDYDDPANPTAYVRNSELHFITGNAEGSNKILASSSSLDERPTDCIFFQAYLGHTETDEYRNLGNLLNGRGYYLEFTDGTELLPQFLSTSGYPGRARFRLWEWMPPSEYVSATEKGNEIYANPTGNAWFDSDTQLKSGGRSRLVADNVIAMIISPRSALPDPGATSAAPDPWEIAPNYHYDSRSAGPIPGRSLQHLLPPLVQITLVAIDEPSALRLAAQNGAAAPTLVYGTSAGTTIFSDPANYEDDLENLQNYLSAQSINFRVFSTTVALRSAKWDANSF